MFMKAKPDAGELIAEKDFERNLDVYIWPPQSITKTPMYEYNEYVRVYSQRTNDTKRALFPPVISAQPPHRTASTLYPIRNLHIPSDGVTNRWFYHSTTPVCRYVVDAKNPSRPLTMICPFDSSSVFPSIIRKAPSRTW